MSRIHRVFRNLAPSGLTLILLFLGSISAFAQGGKITYTLSNLMNGFQSAGNVAIDSAGNLYVTDNDRTLYKETLNGDGTYTQSTINVSSGQPVGIAVDAANNLYVANGAGSILKETYSGGSYTESTAVSGFTNAFGVAVEANGNLFVVDYGAGKVYRETLSGGSYFQGVVATGLSGPNGGIAVDGSGNVYIADTGNSRVLKETFAGGLYTQSVVIDTTTVNSQPTAIAVNSSGTVFVSYNNNGVGTYAAIPNGGAYKGYEITLYGGFGMTTDANAAVYLTDINGVVKLTPNGLATDSGSINFGPHAIGSNGGTQTVTFTFAVATTLANSPFAVSMQGDLQADFQPAQTQQENVCFGGHTYAVGDTCSVTASFLPTLPGTRYGAVAIFQSSNAPVGTAYLQGEGVGPQVSFSPGIVSGPYSVQAGIHIVEDGQGGVVVDGQAGVVDYHLPSKQIQYPVSTGFSTGNGTQFLPDTIQMYGLGIDGAGNILENIAGQSNSTPLVEVDSFVFNPNIPLYSPGTTQFQGRYGDIVVTSINPSGGSNTSAALPFKSVVADGSGNIYFSDQNNNRVLKQSWIGGGYNQQTVIADSFNNPGDVAVDSSGDVFVLDTGNNRVVKETPSDSGYTASTVVDNLASPQSLAIDRLGNLYITLAVQSPPLAPAVLKETLVNGSYQQSSLSIQDAQGVAVDASGNVFIADNQNLSELDVADPPQLHFASTAVGAKSTDSPQIVTLVNNGNDDLTFSVPTSGNNPAITPGFTLDSSSTCPIQSTSSGTGTLRAGSSCILAVNFIPTQSGANQGTLTITDNHLNVPGSTQVVQLNGTATGMTTMSATLTPATYNYGSVTTGMSASQVFTLANTGTASITINSTSLPNAIFTLTKTACGTTLASGASCTYTIVFAPTAVGVQTTTFSVAYNSAVLSSSLAGTGVAAITTAPQAALTPSTANFGSVTTGSSSSAQVFTLSNAGNAALPITSTNITGANASAFVMGSNTCGTSLAAGASCAISISFHAAATGQATATLSVVDSVGTQSASLAGTGVATGAAADFTLTGKPTSQTGARGTSVSYSLLLGSADPNNPFTQLVNLSATGLPAGATVTFSPKSVVPGAASAATSTMTVTIPALTAQLDRESHDGMMLAGVSVTSLLFCFSLSGSRRRRSLRLLMLAIFGLGLVATSLTGCGSGTGFAPPGSTSTITVTGTSGNIMHSTTLTLVVK